MGTPDWGLARIVNAAVEYGYTGIDLRASDFKGEVQVESSHSEIQKVRSIINDSSIEIAGLLCYNEISNGSKDSWKKMEESILHHMDLGLKLSSPSIRIFAGNPHLEESSFSEYVENTASVISSVLEKVSEDISIIIQNHQGSYRALECVELIEKVNNKRFGLAFSPDHSYMMGENLNQVFEKVKSHVKQLYISDVVCAQEGDSARNYISILPGNGVIPLKQAFLAACGGAFNGYISFKWEKIWQDYLEGPEVALPYFVKYWKGIVSSLWI